MILSLVLHIVNTILALYLFLVFTWWWSIQKDATPIYKLTTGLMLGIFLNHVGGSYEYIVAFTHPAHAIEIVPYGPHLYHMVPIDKWWWGFRQMFETTPLLCYAIHITRKIKLNGNINLRRRNSDK